jgi:hypothetical protein
MFRSRTYKITSRIRFKMVKKLHNFIPPRQNNNKRRQTNKKPNLHIIKASLAYIIK